MNNVRSNRQGTAFAVWWTLMLGPPLGVLVRHRIASSGLALLVIFGVSVAFCFVLEKAFGALGVARRLPVLSPIAVGLIGGGLALTSAVITNALLR